MQNEPALTDGPSFGGTGHLHEAGGVPADPGGGVGPCDIRLSLNAVADQVVLVRHVIGSVAESLGFTVPRIEDMRLAVTEACTNVVRHAYDGAPGRLDVAATAATDGLTVTVADHGRGLRPRVEDGPAGLGLPLMAALAASVEFGDTGGRGTTVRLSFARAE